VAGAADRVTGVESNGEAVEAARVNQGINGIENADFIHSEAREFLARGVGSYDTVVLDPPRSGMQRHAMEALDLIGAETIVYMSCNPATFRDDVAILKNYRIESIEAFDMFPQTPHVELLSVLRHA
jgi:23S rRNA (uracil1939-C5)-methyltransferase